MAAEEEGVTAEAAEEEVTVEAAEGVTAEAAEEEVTVEAAAAEGVTEEAAEAAAEGDVTTVTTCSTADFCRCLL